MPGREDTRVRWLHPGLVAVLLVVAAWEGGSRVGWLDPVLMSSPGRIFKAAARLFESGALTGDIIFTLQVFGVSIVLAMVLGFGAGVVMGINRFAYQVLNPFVVMANGLPKVVLMPWIVLWLGISMAANVFLGTLMASFPVLTSVYGGVRQMDGDLVLLARSFGASRRFVWFHVLLPSLLPHILAGLRVAISYTMVGVILAEFFASNRGLGHRMVVYMSNFDVDAFFVCVVLVACWTVGCTSIVRALERRVESWRSGAFDGSGGGV